MEFLFCRYFLSYRFTLNCLFRSSNSIGLKTPTGNTNHFPPWALHFQFCNISRYCVFTCIPFGTYSIKRCFLLHTIGCHEDAAKCHHFWQTPDQVEVASTPKVEMVSTSARYFSVAFNFLVVFFLWRWCDHWWVCRLPVLTSDCIVTKLNLQVSTIASKLCM